MVPVRTMALAMLAILIAVGAFGSEPLTLDEAEGLAMTADPNLPRLWRQALSFEDEAVAEGELPDPTLSLGLQNWPIETFDFRGEPMTHVVVGISQAFPRGATRSLRSQRAEAFADVERAQHRDAAAQAILAVRLAWLDLYFWTEAAKVVRETESVQEDLIAVTEFLFSTGRRSQQDVLQAELELSLLQDRQVQIARETDISRAELAKSIGHDHALRPLAGGLPELPAPVSAQVMAERLVDHPRVAVEDHLLSARQTEIDLAHQAYRPEWNIGVTYGLRVADRQGERRSDFLSVMLMMDLPIFTERRQDRRLSARKHQAAAALHARDAQLRELKRMLDGQYADWVRLGERADLYERVVISRADDALEAALQAYQNDLIDFSALMRAQITALETRLQWLQVQIDRASAQANLLYLEGGSE